MIARARRGAIRVARGAARRLGVRRLLVWAYQRVSDTSLRVDHQTFAGAAPFPGELEVSEWMAFRGHLFASATLPTDIDGSLVAAVAVLFETETWEHPVMAGGPASWVTPIPASQASSKISLGLRCADGRRYLVDDPSAIVIARHDFGSPHKGFMKGLEELDGGLVVEVGARARSGRTYLEIVPESMSYLGMDILEGPNVDLVGDAHELSRLIEPGTVDGVFSIATFEHLAMPWKCAVEINKVLKPGGLCFVLSHQTFPLHETPWDFFRFSDSAWRAIFNEATGFEILDVAMGEPAAVAGLAVTPITWNMDRASAYLGSSVLCRKIGEATVDWAVPMHAIERSVYPGETQPPG